MSNYWRNVLSRAETIQRIQNLRADRWTWQEVANHLNAEGYRQLNGRLFSRGSAQLYWRRVGLPPSNINFTFESCK